MTPKDEELVRYPGVFFAQSPQQRISVATYRGQSTLTFSWLLENKPGGAWLELEMEPGEAEAFARTILHRVEHLRTRTTGAMNGKKKIDCGEIAIHLLFGAALTIELLFFAHRVGLL